MLPGNRTGDITRKDDLLKYCLRSIQIQNLFFLSILFSQTNLRYNVKVMLSRVFRLKWGFTVNEIISGMINNAFFVFFPIFLYYLFYHQGKDRFFNNDKFILTVLFSISVALCIFFPYQFVVTEDYLFDLRQVPLIIGTLYGGYIVGAVLFIVSAVARLIIGGDGVYIALLNQFAIFAFVPLFRSAYFKLVHKKRIVMITIISAGSLAFNAIAGKIIFNDPFLDSLDLWFILLLNQSVFIILTTIVIERIIKNNYIEQNMQKHEKLEVISHLSASISHEIRNPLQVIKGFIQLLNAKEYDREKQKEFYQYMNEEIESAERIISDYLMFAKPTFDDQETISVEREIEKAISIIQPYANLSSISIQYSGLDDDHLIDCDQQRFKQVLINIARNSIEAMDGGGKLTFQVKDDMHHVLVNIHDTGRGMSEEEIIRLGEPYYSNKATGTGLGMMVVYSILKNIHATIEVDSVPEKGTKFHIRIPISKNQVN